MKLTSPAIALCALTTACSPVPDSQGPETTASQDVQQVSQGILNGTDLSSNGLSAAVYHSLTQPLASCPSWPAGWLSRPCSGTVLKRTGSQTYVLTARHCVTTDGTTGGPLVASGALRVSTAVNPGPVAMGGSPPASALPATVVGAAAGTDVGTDLAIVRVDSQLPLSSPRRLRVFRDTKAVLAWWRWKVDFGYGRKLAGDCDGDVNSGAGQLRYASQFELKDVRDDYYVYDNINSSGQQIIHGDSGGGAFIREFDTGELSLIGVHSTGAMTPGKDAGSTKLAEFIQSRMGGLFLARFNDVNSTNVVGVAVAGPGAVLQWQRSGDVSTNRVYFVSIANRLQIAGYCANDEGNGVAVKTQLCNQATPTQNWTVANGTIKNLSTGRCLLADDSGVVVSGDCSWSRAQWAWLTAATP